MFCGLATHPSGLNKSEVATVGRRKPGRGTIDAGKPGTPNDLGHVARIQGTNSGVTDRPVMIGIKKKNQNIIMISGIVRITQ